MTTVPAWSETVSSGILLNQIINRIRQSLELQEILETTASEVRMALEWDRVMLYQFHPDSHGEVVAEAIRDNRLPSLLGLHFPADDIPQWARELYVKTRQRSIVNVAERQIGFSPLLCAETGEALPTEAVYYRTVDPCHIQYLTAMGVQSSLVIPILYYDLQSHQAEPHLWGLLVAHNIEAQPIQEETLHLLQQVVDQVAIAVAQSALLQQARAKANQEATINQIAALLHALPQIQLQEALTDSVAALNASGGRLYLKSDSELPAVLHTWGQQPQRSASEPEDWLETHPMWQFYFGNPSSQTAPDTPQAIPDLYRVAALRTLVAAFRPTPIRGLLVVPLYYRQQMAGYLTFFRNEVNTETLWAGQFDPDLRQLQPRNSFDMWREFKQHQAPQWTNSEIELGRLIGYHFAMAVRQYQLYEQVHTLNANLELQVQERTRELQQALESDRILKSITDQIRSTLDSQEILTTIVREVQAWLKTDRALIYQFQSESQGEVIVEAIQGDWIPTLGTRYHDECFPQQYAKLYQQGRIRAIHDVVQSDLHECHIAFLQKLQVQANLVVPIRIGQQLWGLLITHQCDQPRHWRLAELTLLQQLADQAAIAIHQAQLYEHSCHAAATATAQAHQLEQALQELQQTQTQLIQSEKMSSLGQLVAGVAHEINNPVNFIYGNLNHISGYAQDLLDLVQLYQIYYPEPAPAIEEHIEAIDLEFLHQDMPKLLASMKMGADRIRQIVLSLRNFSRLDQAEMKPVDVHEGLDSTLLILQHRLKPKPDRAGIQVIKQYGSLPLVECYAGQLNQVFMNILTNAIDALEETIELKSWYHQTTQATLKYAPSLTLRTEMAADRIRVTIADNGMGIPEETRSRIFDPFFTTKPIGRGTGLGLSISYQIVVERHGGLLTCHSTVGEGTEFCLEIPTHLAIHSTTPIVKARS